LNIVCDFSRKHTIHNIVYFNFFNTLYSIQVNTLHFIIYLKQGDTSVQVKF